MDTQKHLRRGQVNWSIWKRHQLLNFFLLEIPSQWFQPAGTVEEITLIPFDYNVFLRERNNPD